MDDPIDLPIDGQLDLHPFRPQDVKEVLFACLEECQRRGILEVRVVHGKGIGQLRQTVHALLGRHSEVVSFSLATEPFGGSGATFVRLRLRAPLPSN